MKPTRIILLLAILATGALQFCLDAPATHRAGDSVYTAHKNNVVFIAAANESRGSLPESQKPPAFQARPDIALQVTIAVAAPFHGPLHQNGISPLLNNKARHYFRAWHSLRLSNKLFRVVISPNAP